MVAFFFLLASLVIFLLVRCQRQETGLPGGRVIYSDTRAWNAVEDPLYAADLQLVGKPDYLIQNSQGIIPVEVKSSRVGETPYDSHIYQLAAYCLLVKTVFGKRPRFGILHYSNRTFAIDYSPELETTLLALLEEIRQAAPHKEIHRSHASAERCRGCGYRPICDEAV